MPDVVFEVTSRSTRREDSSFKPQLYAQLGVGELFLYDPTSDYLRPALQGYRLTDGAFRRLTTNADGCLECQRLGLTLQLDDRRLVLRDSQTGELLRTEAEVALARAEQAEDRAEQAEDQAEQAKNQAEQAKNRAEQAEARAARLQQELELLRQQLQRGSAGTP